MSICFQLKDNFKTGTNNVLDALLFYAYLKKKKVN